MSAFALQFRWALRDLRQRWWQVLAVGIIIALGTGVYCGLGSNTPWRIQSFHESYAMLNMYDLKMELTPGSYLPAGDLAQVVGGIEHRDWIQDAEMRLGLPTFVDASVRRAGAPEQMVMVPGRIIGVASGGPTINRLHVTAGRGLQPSDSGDAVCVLENNFAQYYDLTPGDREIRIRGGRSLDYVGNAITPEYFMVLTEEGGIMAQANFAALFVPLATAQEIADLPGMVNDLLVTATADADVETLEREIARAMEAAFPQVGLTFETRAENAVYALMKEDIPGDQELYDVFAYLLLLGAAFGAFNLISRMVEAQRREIGIGMALGVAPRVIALRHLLVGVQIAVLGMVLGLGVGVILSNAYASVVRGFLPMPYFETPFQFAIFLKGALLGVIVPLVAVVYPIWRAVRVTPIEAIQTGHLVARGGGLAPFLARFHLPGAQGRLRLSSLARFPFRNLLRNPRRTLLTALGIAMAITLLIATRGMLDSAAETLDAARVEHLQGRPDMMLVGLDGFYPVAGLSAMTQGTSSTSGQGLDAMISQATPFINLPGRVSSQGREGFDVLIQLMDLDSDLWSPTLLQGAGAGPAQSQDPAPAAGAGVIIAQKAARDLGVDVGDTIVLQHPYRESLFAYRQEESEVQVIGIHADVARMYVYMDRRDAALMNLDGLANGLRVDPAPGVEREVVRKELSQMPGVVSVQPVSALLDTFDDLIDMMVDLFTTSQYVAILLAFLIAFNTSSINVDERRRELATMFAFGTRVRTAIRMAVVENLVTGIMGTVAGIGLGWVVLQRLLIARTETMIPELGLLIHVSPATLGLVGLLGVLVVALTPVFTARRIIKMDIPATLRVVE